MNINEMNIDEIETRVSELKAELDKPEADIDAIAKEIEDIESRKLELKEAQEKRQAVLDEVIKAGETVIELKEDRNMSQVETRNTLEYGKAFVKAIISGDDTEARALLTENVSGTIPVPEVLETEIKNAWEDCQVLSLAKKTNYKGNLKVGFEYSATGAVIHVEGTDAPTEETLVLGVVEIKNESIKKWITISDEAIDNTTIDTLGYIYKELAQKIAESAEEVAVGKIVAAPATSTQSACGVPVYVADTPAEDTVLQAVSLLSAKAKKLNILMNRQTKAAIKAVALKAKYAVDVFDGLEDKIIYTDALPAFQSAGAGDTYLIVGDFGYGLQVNFPSNELKITVDEVSLAEKDLVKVIGRELVGLGVVAPKAFTKVKKAD